MGSHQSPGDLSIHLLFFAYNTLFSTCIQQIIKSITFFASLTCSRWQYVSLSSCISNASILLLSRHSRYGKPHRASSQWKHLVTSAPPYCITSLVAGCERPSSTHDTAVFWSPMSTTHALPTPVPNVAQTDSWTQNATVLYKIYH